MRFTSERVECWILSWVLLLVCECEQITRVLCLNQTIPLDRGLGSGLWEEGAALEQEEKDPL